LEVDIILDSGAYSAWNSGDVITVEEYGTFLEANRDSFKHCVNLDVIPGVRNKKPTPAEVDASAAAGWENLKRLEDRGFDPIPVFHQGEEFTWLEKMLKEGYEYIGISPANDRSTPEKRAWLDFVFTLITDDDGVPVVKTHGFGMTAIPLVYRYPWYSVDSITWIILAGYGSVMVPRVSNGKLDYASSPICIATSSRASSIKKGKHFHNFGDQTKEMLTEYFEELGTSISDLESSPYARNRINAVYFQRAIGGKGILPFTHRNGFFAESFPCVSEMDSMKFKTTMVYALVMSPQFSEVLTSLEIKDRLVSYNEYKRYRPGSLKKYSQTGIVPDDLSMGRKKKKKKKSKKAKVKKRA
tara:strand:+ start:151 stop:1218 length:1068 start_codon:yes stop_codon:yes gene_type:complete